jgi:hypothetical protein
MQNRYVGDVGDYLKLGILRALSPGHRLGVAWWLYPDGSNRDGRHIEYLHQPVRWRQFDPPLFDALAETVASGQRDVRALESAHILPGTVFASEMIPSFGPIAGRQQSRQEWFARVRQKLIDCDLVSVDPDNGLQPDGFSHGSAKAGKSVLTNELLELARPGRCLIVYHHQTRRTGGHHSEIEHWAERLRATGFATVDALRARPYSPRVYFLLNATLDIRQRAERLEGHWQGLITWRPGAGADGHWVFGSPSGCGVASPMMPTARPDGSGISAPRAHRRSDRVGSGRTTEPGYVNQNGQEVIRPTGISGTDHGQYVHVLRCLNVRPRIWRQWFGHMAAAVSGAR